MNLPLPASLAIGVADIALILSFATWMSKQNPSQFKWYRTVAYAAICAILAAPGIYLGLRIALNGNDWGGVVACVSVAAVPAILWLLIGERPVRHTEQLSGAAGVPPQHRH